MRFSDAVFLQEQEHLIARKIRGLPFPKRRDPSGRLFAASSDKIPPLAPPSKALSCPINLGSLEWQLDLQNVRSLHAALALSAWRFDMKEACCG